MVAVMERLLRVWRLCRCSGKVIKRIEFEEGIERTGQESETYMEEGAPFGHLSSYHQSGKFALDILTPEPSTAVSMGLTDLSTLEVSCVRNASYGVPPIISKSACRAGTKAWSDFVSNSLSEIGPLWNYTLRGNDVK
jgi:hypothetical protein